MAPSVARESTLHCQPGLSAAFGGAQKYVIGRTGPDNGNSDIIGGVIWPNERTAASVGRRRFLGDDRGLESRPRPALSTGPRRRAGGRNSAAATLLPHLHPSRPARFRLASLLMFTVV